MAKSLTMRKGTSLQPCQFKKKFHIISLVKYKIFQILVPTLYCFARRSGKIHFQKVIILQWTLFRCHIHPEWMASLDFDPEGRLLSMFNNGNALMIAEVDSNNTMFHMQMPESYQDSGNVYFRHIRMMLFQILFHAVGGV